MIGRKLALLSAAAVSLCYGTGLAAQEKSQANGVPGLAADIEAVKSVNDAQDVAIQAILDALQNPGPGSGYSVLRTQQTPQVISVDCAAGDNLQDAIDNAQAGFVQIQISGVCTGTFAISRDGIELRGQGQGATRIEGSVAYSGARNSRLQSLTIDGDGTALTLTNYSTVLMVNTRVESTGSAAGTAVQAISSRILAGFGSNITMATTQNFGAAADLFSGAVLAYIGGGLTVQSNAAVDARALRLLNGSQLVTNNSDQAPLDISASGGNTSVAVRAGKNAIVQQLVTGPVNVVGDIVANHAAVQLSQLAHTGQMRLLNNSSLEIASGGGVSTDAIYLANLSHLGVGGLLSFNGGGAVEAVINSVVVGFSNGRIEGEVTLYTGTRMALSEQSSALAVVEQSDETNALYVSSGTGAYVGP